MPWRFRIFPESLFFIILSFAENNRSCDPAGSISVVYFRTHARRAPGMLFFGGVMSTYVFCITVLLIAAKIISECVQ